MLPKRDLEKASICGLQNKMLPVKGSLERDSIHGLYYLKCYLEEVWRGLPSPGYIRKYYLPKRVWRRLPSLGYRINVT
jgi:hypothetical protein